MIKVTKKVGGNARSGFIAQQKAIAKVEGFVEEMMHGQKVIKVFCHEEEAKKDFDKLNEALNDAMYFANTNASRMGPIMGNIGNIMYVFLAFIGALLITLSLNGHNIYNLSITGLKVVSVDYFLPIVISFLTLARQFSINVNQVFQQFNQIVMASAAATRIYKLIDEPKEVDNGYVTLVNVKENENHELVETTERTGIWAWKHPHTETGEVTYKRLEGDIRMIDVDFGYSEDKIVLHNINLYALPGQKVAFVGSTGAGKTTITNLLNRFYDIADGKIRYDGININKIKKADLRRSLGIVLQDTNLFTGTVMENIRYGRLDATDEECIEAAKLANAHDFITRLPDGYNTMLLADGANLSQGQRQLLSIASAAVADAPVMILDEATSSIDTRTEQLVQKGTNELMKGRTVFFIAHRLSTVQNSDVIMVLENGEIIERGNHKELINKKGKYYQLYTGAYELE
jgi:ATP-binding cassette subfamily B protein